MDDAAPKRGPGRPRKRPLTGNRRSVTLRITETTYKRIVAASEEAGRSISEEIEARLDQSLHLNDLKQTLREVLAEALSPPSLNPAKPEATTGRLAA